MKQLTKQTFSIGQYTGTNNYLVYVLGDNRIVNEHDVKDSTRYNFLEYPDKNTSFSDVHVFRALLETREEAEKLLKEIYNVLREDACVEDKAWERVK